MRVGWRWPSIDSVEEPALRVSSKRDLAIGPLLTKDDGSILNRRDREVARELRMTRAPAADKAEEAEDRSATSHAAHSARTVSGLNILSPTSFRYANMTMGSCRSFGFDANVETNRSTERIASCLVNEAKSAAGMLRRW